MLDNIHKAMRLISFFSLAAACVAHFLGLPELAWSAAVISILSVAVVVLIDLGSVLNDHFDADHQDEFGQKTVEIGFNTAAASASSAVETPHVDRSALEVRPNTGLPAAFVQPDMIICSGEDPEELRSVLKECLPELQPEEHHYRCYRAWRYPGFTVILSGIGTGCLEPLMFEILDSELLKGREAGRLVLMGTAGYLASEGFGQVYLVGGAYTVGSAVALEDDTLPLRPRFKNLDSIQMDRREEISTDYYYACSPKLNNPRIAAAKAKNPMLRKGIESHWKANRLIAMETGQFYHFADVYGGESTQWVALRGVANLADAFETQALYSRNVLCKCFKAALCILGHAL